MAPVSSATVTALIASSALASLMRSLSAVSGASPRATVFAMSTATVVPFLARPSPALTKLVLYWVMVRSSLPPPSPPSSTKSLPTLVTHSVLA